VHRHEHSVDVIVGPDGSEEYREPWIVEGEDILARPYSGSVCVHTGATFTIASGGQHSGSLTFQPSSTGRIVGRHSGSLHVSSDTDVEVIGTQSGSVHVATGAVIRVGPTGTLAGSLHVSGVIENRGTRGGSVHLVGGEIRDLDGGSVKQPIVRDGTSVYRW
jgi:hypothetical protein